MKTIEAIGSNGRLAHKPSTVVTDFLEAMARADLERTLELIDDELVYENVSLPTIRGRERFRKGAERFFGSGVRFEVRIHRIAEKDGAVLTERTDALIFGPVRAQFWVCGTFEVRDGVITLWRDYFDWANVTAGVLRGLVGALVPPLRAQFPATAD